MTKCECYHEREECIYNCPPIFKTYSVCYGTRECDECYCGGDRSKCDFYPEIRKQALEETNEEIWKDIKGYEGLYQVSNLGNVRSLPNQKHKDNIILKQRISNGYYQVTLYKNNQPKAIYVHRLVAEAFIPNPDDLPQIGHRDENNFKTGDDCNNRADNLYWCTLKENCNTPKRRERLKLNNHGMKGHNHTEETKRKMSEAQRGEKGYWYGKHLSQETKDKISKAAKGKNNKQCKAVRCIETGIVYYSATNAGEETHNRANAIIACCRGKRKTCGGLHWEYVMTKAEAEKKLGVHIVD